MKKHGLYFVSKAVSAVERHFWLFWYICFLSRAAWVSEMLKNKVSYQQSTYPEVRP